jgi:RNA recognition motif-containing protein
MRFYLVCIIYFILFFFIYQIYEAAKVFAPVESVKIGKDKQTGLSRGFAFIEMPTIDGVCVCVCVFVCCVCLC